MGGQTFVLSLFFSSLLFKHSSKLFLMHNLIVLKFCTNKEDVKVNSLRDGPHFSAVSRAYKTYARGEGVRIYIRF